MCVVFSSSSSSFRFFFCFFGERRDERVSFVILSFLVLLPVLRVCSSAGVEEEPFLNLPYTKKKKKKKKESVLRVVLCFYLTNVFDPPHLRTPLYNSRIYY